MQVSYLPIQRLDVEAESKVTFDVYIHLPLNQRYLLFRRRGGSIDSRRLDHFAQGNVRNFFIRREDYKEFVRYVADRVRKYISPERSEDHERMVKQAVKAILSSTFEAEDPKMVVALVNNLNDVSSVIVDEVLQSRRDGRRKVFRQLLELSGKGTNFQKHPLNVTSFATLLTIGIGYNSPRILSDVAVAALIHDIGLTRLPAQTIAKAHRPLELSIADRHLLYQHPKYTLDLLKERKVNVSSLSETIILQHHEQFNGTGYPAGLRGFEINELSQILFIADELDQMISDQKNTANGLRVALEEFLNRLRSQLIIEPLLLSRIRNILL